jgi:hypothetical protein
VHYYYYYYYYCYYYYYDYYCSSLLERHLLSSLVQEDVHQELHVITDTVDRRLHVATQDMVAQVFCLDHCFVLERPAGQLKAKLLVARDSKPVGRRTVLF